MTSLLFLLSLSTFYCLDEGCILEESGGKENPRSKARNISSPFSQKVLQLRGNILSLNSFQDSLATNNFLLDAAMLMNPRLETTKRLQNKRGCGDQVFANRQILQQRDKYNRSTVTTSLEFKSSFDSVNRNAIWDLAYVPVPRDATENNFYSQEQKR